MEKVLIPFKATHPGILIKDELIAREIKQKEFARDIEMPLTVLNEIINGKRSITADIALSLEKALDIPAEYWMRFQAGYEIDCARIKEKNIKKSNEIEIWKSIKEYVPIKYFSKLELFSNTLSQNIEKIWDIYNVKSIDELVSSFSVHQNLALYKKSKKLKNDNINIFAWSKFAQWKAKQIVTKNFDYNDMDLIITELLKIIRNNTNTIDKIKTFLNNNGIKFIVVPKFDRVPIDGYSFWSVNNPAIVITLRIKKIDNLAFTLMHEIGHIFKHLYNDKNNEFLNIETSKCNTDQKEDEANQFANSILIDEYKWKDFLNKHSTFNYNTTEKRIIELADELKTHPGVIFGRYCFETNNYKIKTNIDRAIY